jgi:hypothetical protein
MEDVRVASFSWGTNARYRQDGGTMALSTLLCAWDCQFLVIAAKSERPQKYKLLKSDSICRRSRREIFGTAFALTESQLGDDEQAQQRRASGQ